jgi:glycerol-3-phosphate cytidylyltransferase-like family protein/2-polyprenyl-3-methyl-5-hydroxy-6-metoxy-1,4-benzoquinol methylase
VIVDTAELHRLRGQLAMVDGGFDPLHAGHVEYFAAAAELGVPVLCNLSSDDWIARKHPVLLPQEQRARLIDAMRDIDYTHVSTGTTADVLRELRPRYYVKGSDWRDRLPEEELAVCEEFGIEIVYLDTVRDSSTRIMNRYVTETGRNEKPVSDFEGEVQAFEDQVLAQEPVAAAHYDDEYFVSDWREGGNKYDVETRREIEGRNPALIKEVFQPERVLDMGCGPGVLMYLLAELGVEADGIDFSPEIKALAPPEVRERIIVGEVTEPHVPDGSYDLVVCREVMEHLTVLQVRQTVATICRASSRFVYLTTRFHPEPDSLLSFTTQFDVDPSHITLLNKEFLRCLFVLEGFQRRSDLEERMDWGDKRRVLVYEKQPRA